MQFRARRKLRNPKIIIFNIAEEIIVGKVVEALKQKIQNWKIAAEV